MTPKERKEELLRNIAETEAQIKLLDEMILKLFIKGHKHGNH